MRNLGELKHKFNTQKQFLYIQKFLIKVCMNLCMIPYENSCHNFNDTVNFDVFYMQLVQ